MELTVESLYEEVKRLKLRIEFVESLIIEEEAPAAEDEKKEIEDFSARKRAGEVNLIPIKEAMRALEIDEDSVRREIREETEEAY